MKKFLILGIFGLFCVAISQATPEVSPGDELVLVSDYDFVGDDFRVISYGLVVDNAIVVAMGLTGEVLGFSGEGLVRDSREHPRIRDALL